LLYRNGHANFCTPARAQFLRLFAGGKRNSQRISQKSGFANMQIAYTQASLQSKEADQETDKTAGAELAIGAYWAWKKRGSHHAARWRGTISGSQTCRTGLPSQRIEQSPGGGCDTRRWALCKRMFVAVQTLVPGCGIVAMLRRQSRPESAMTKSLEQNELNKKYRAAFDELKAAVAALDAYLRRGPNEGVDALLRERLQSALQRASEKAEKIYSSRPHT
jgi:hypothetical protein